MYPYGNFPVTSKNNMWFETFGDETVPLPGKYTRGVKMRLERT